MTESLLIRLWANGQSNSYFPIPDSVHADAVSFSSLHSPLKREGRR